MLNYFVREEPRGKPQGVKIKEIPNLSSPQRISQLNFSHNEIRIIPAHITTVLNLQIIDLSHNKITKIQHIYRLTCLKFVNLSHNLISEVPLEMTQMVEVENIDLSFNRIAILNNIKVLKQLAEIRIFDFHGFLEVNLEGNEILKKKGCKEIYKKWMNPSKEEYQKRSRQDTRDGYIHLTKKRNSKSLEVPIREHSMMTQRVNLQKMEETKCFDHKKKEESDSNMKKSIQMTEKLSPNFVSSQERSDIKDNPLIIKSQILNSFQNCKDLSKIYESVTIQDINNLGEWFCTCIGELNDLKHKFQLITSNEDINSLSLEVRKMLVQESAMARQIIVLCLRVVKEAIDNKLTKQMESKSLGEIVLLDGKIKDLHLQILKCISGNTEHLPIKVYKIWVSLYRRLKVIITMIPEKVDMHKFSYLREQQIQELLSISPDKNKLILPSQKKQETIKHSSSRKLSASKDRLNDLLFSNKSECLLLSDNKDVRASSEKKVKRKVDGQKEECQNCLMLKWLNTKNKEQMADLNDKLHVLQRDNQENLQTIKNLQKFKEKYLVLADKQDLIIGQLEYLKPSTYQNLMLQQAKAIEYMLKTKDLVDYKQLNSMPKQIKDDQLRQYTSKQMDKDKSIMLNTRLSSSKNCKENSNRNKVSEFSVQGKKEMITKESSNANRGSSYFKNKNIITTINRTGDDPKTHIVGEYLASEESRPKNDLNHRQEVVVSQFNSHLNSAEKSSGKGKNITFENFTTENNLSREFTKNNRKVTQKSNGNDIIPISQGTDIKNANLSKKQQQKSRVEHNDNKNHTFQYLKSQEFNTLLREKLMHEQQASMGKQASKVIKQASNKTKGKQTVHRHSKRVNSDLSDKQNQKPDQLKRNKTSDRLYQDNISHAYIAMNSQQAQSYKRYMKYHLRNNIIEILYKKNSGVIDNQSQKYPQISKNQKLINKPNNTQRSESEGGLSKRSEINRTFR